VHSSTRTRPRSVLCCRSPICIAPKTDNIAAPSQQKLRGLVAAVPSGSRRRREPLRAEASSPLPTLALSPRGEYRKTTEDALQVGTSFALVHGSGWGSKPWSISLRKERPDENHHLLCPERGAQGKTTRPCDGTRVSGDNSHAVPDGPPRRR